MSDEKKAEKEALKRLREERKNSIDQAKAAIKAQAQTLKAIRQAMESGSATIPEISEATGMPTAQVLLFVATLRKYGLAVEGPKDGDYFRYELAAPAK